MLKQLLYGDQISTEKIEPFKINIAAEVNYSNQGKISLKLNKTVLIQEAFTFIYKNSKYILTL